MKGFDLFAILGSPEFARMLLHGIALTFVVAAGSWCLAMSLGIGLLVIRLMPLRIAEGAVAALCFLSSQCPDARAADALVLRHREPVARPGAILAQRP